MRTEAYRGLGWARGALVVQRRAAMLAPITFILDGGLQVSPMQVAPWAYEPGEVGGVLHRLRGDWPCVPFGATAASSAGWPEAWAKHMAPPEPGEEQHGHGSNHDWTWLEDDGKSLRLAIDYPADNPVKRLERTVTPDPDAPAVDITLTVEVREDCRLPFGLHPTFRLPTDPGGARIETAPFIEGRTYPAVFEPDAQLFAPDSAFTSLGAVPGLRGNTVDASRLPFIPDCEELLQLNGIAGEAALANAAEGYRVRLRWQQEHFPSLCLWMSNRGRKMAPWNGRHLALGMEPVCSPFGLGPATARADNPLAASGTPTAYPFVAGKPFTTRYRIEAEAL